MRFWPGSVRFGQMGRTHRQTICRDNSIRRWPIVWPYWPRWRRTHRTSSVSISECYFTSNALPESAQPRLLNPSSRQQCDETAVQTPTGYAPSPINRNPQEASHLITDTPTLYSLPVKVERCRAVCMPSDMLVFDGVHGGSETKFSDSHISSISRPSRVRANPYAVSTILHFGSPPTTARGTTATTACVVSTGDTRDLVRRDREVRADLDVVDVG